MRHKHATEVLLHQSLVEVATRSRHERVVSVTSKDEHFSLLQRPDPISELVIIGLNLRINHNLTIARQLARGALLRSSWLRHLVLFWDSQGFEACVHEFLLQVSCLAHKWPSLCLYDSELINLLELVYDSKSSVD